MTVRVLALVKGFCSRYARQARQDHRQSSKKGKFGNRGRYKRSGRPTRDVSRDMELKAYEEIDRYLGRKIACSLNRPGLPKKKEQPAIQLNLLDKLDGAVNNQSRDLATTAKDHCIFITRKAEFALFKLSPRELIELFIAAKQLLETLKGQRRLLEGNEIVNLEFDELGAANLEHLLLCLATALLQRFITEAFGQSRRWLVECQRDQNIHAEDWFFEYPRGQHPLSTTWPWALKPSLAVLWGVCWMFYTPGRWDAYGNWCSALTGEVMVAAHIARQYRIAMEPVSMMGVEGTRQERGAEGTYRQDMRQLMPRQGYTTSRAGPAPSRVSASPFRQQFLQPVANGGLHNTNRHINAPIVPSDQLQLQSEVYSARDLLRLYTDPILGSTATQHTSVPAASQAAAATSSGLPRVPQVHHSSSPSTQFQQHNRPYGHSAGSQWQHSSPDQSFVGHIRVPSSAPPQTRATPSTLTRPLPLPYYYDFSSLPQDTNSPNSAGTTYSTNSFNFQTQYYATMAEVAPAMAAMARAMPSADDYTPHDHMPDLDPAITNGRKRSYDEMAGPDEAHSVMPQPQPEMLSHLIPAQHDPTTYPPPPMQQHMPYTQQEMQEGPVSDQEPAGQDSAQEGDLQEESPRASKSVKRDAPQVNANGKMYCSVPECGGETFDRKCEYNKHMDKHQRPYRCANPDCAKLQGFTYSGGLLRHEREVHGKHGGPKAQLMCPVMDCKRHKGKGFTRRENLNEHVRRVHDGRTPAAVPQEAEDALKVVLEHAIAGAEPVAADLQLTESLPYPDSNATQYPVETAEMVKRRRIDEEPDVSVEVNEVQAENERLRSENDQLRAQLRDMETREAVREQRLAQFEAFFNAGQQPIQGQQEMQEMQVGAPDMKDQTDLA
ncbi:hypothetical protein LTR62_001916 [Meristemomyces frigidus]|uniref:C2H2-type domain-containing protein n=1 Tax=Meristemomyces frigidus TaxID=1508187 RepID=A0AAN7YB07_9PEZI|nr:hypothetical protein LTR62_001916 [Meristemomyces frigidus]